MSETAIARQLLAPSWKATGILHNCLDGLEALIGVAAGVLAGSISLVGFGVDSLIVVTSGATLLWRMSVDAHVGRRERNERLSLRIVGSCFLGLALYIAYGALSDLTRKSAP